MVQIRDLDSLLNRLLVVRQEHGNLPLTVTVNQEDRGQMFVEHRDVLSAVFNSTDNVMELLA